MKAIGFRSYRRGVGANFWNDSGCNTIHFENGSVMCSCNHLTHFGVLFDTGGEPVSDFVHLNQLRIVLFIRILFQEDEGLKIFGRVLSSISLVLLLATILTFVLHKSVMGCYYTIKSS